MAVEVDIPLRDNYFLRIRRRKQGDVEVRLWYRRTDGIVASLPEGVFLSPEQAVKTAEALRFVVARSSESAN